MLSYPSRINRLQEEKNLNGTLILLKEIALQPGLSLATFDRALHGRAHVSAQTARRVQVAKVELAELEGQFSARVRWLLVDVVGEAPYQFSDELR